MLTASLPQKSLMNLYLLGIFIAKISKGRTIREFINGTMTAPILYTFAWFGFFGATGLGIERLAAAEGYCCKQNFFDNTTVIGSSFQTSATLLSVSDFSEYCNGTCNPCSESILNHAVSHDMSQKQTFDWIAEGEKNMYARSDDKQRVRLSCYSLVQMWFFTMETNGDLGTFLDVISLAAIIMYFVTSSDSGSFIIDMLGSNGDMDPPTLQRIFWALTEGAAATALLVAGGDEALNALQTVSIVCGLPYTIIVCFLCVALWRACAVAFHDIDAHAPDFQVGYLDFATEFKMDIILEWLLGFVLGPYWAAKAACNVWKMKDFVVYIWAAVVYLLLFTFILFHFLHLAVDEFWALAWTCFFGFAAIMGLFRTAVRDHHGYIGNTIEDFFAALFLYPSVGQQLRRCDVEEVKPIENLPPVHQLNNPKREMEPPQYGMVQPEQESN